jgi:hypothetical protein
MWLHPCYQKKNELENHGLLDQGCLTCLDVAQYIEMKTSLHGAYLNLEVDLNPQDDLQGNVGNAIKLGIIGNIVDKKNVDKSNGCDDGPSLEEV